MIKRILQFYSIPKVVFIFSALIINIFYNCISFYIYHKREELDVFLSLVLLMVIFVSFLANEKVWKNYKYIKTGKIEDATNDILTNDLKELKNARLNKDVLFVQTNERFYYSDNDYK